MNLRASAYRSVIKSQPIRIYPDSVSQRPTSAPPSSDTSCVPCAEVEVDEEQSTRPRPKSSVPPSSDTSKASQEVEDRAKLSGRLRPGPSVPLSCDTSDKTKTEMESSEELQSVRAGPDTSAPPTSDTNKTNTEVEVSEEQSVRAEPDTSAPPTSDTNKTNTEVEVSEEQSAHPMPYPPDTRASPNQKDLMISYSHADREIMLKIRDNLEKYGISVWVDVSGLTAGVDFLSKIGEAIIDCKLFLSLLSSNSVNSRYCRDELALAYVSNKAIFPAAIESRKDLLPLMDTGMKLQLASYEWVEIGQDPAQFDAKFQTLLKYLKEELLRQESGADTETSSKKEEKKEETNESSESEKLKVKPPLMRQKKKPNLYEERMVSNSAQGLKDDDVSAETYWKKNFGVKEAILFEEFWTCFQRDYNAQLNVIIGSEEDLEWLKSVLTREMEVNEGKLYRYALIDFCNVDDECYNVWDRMSTQARESWAMKEVFDMDSSVRVDAIENLGKFRTAAVIDALRDLLSDEDVNVRAVAAVSLARTDANDPVTVKFLMKTLNDKDRLVREAGCLALGHLQARHAVNKLLHMWRNDVISHVREAANVALSQIGGPEVEKAMRVTKVLADEIRQLTEF